MVAGSAWSAASDPSRSAAVHACPPDCLRPNRAATSVDDAANPAQRERRKLLLELCKPHRIGLPLGPVMLLQSGENSSSNSRAISYWIAGPPRPREACPTS